MAGYGAGFPPVKQNKIPAGYYGQAKFDAAQGERLDWHNIRRSCDVHGTRELLDKVQASTLPSHGNAPRSTRG